MMEMSPSPFFQFMVEKNLKKFPAAALISTEGELLFSHIQTIVDVGTLPSAALTCHKYFQLKPNDVVLLNDPYSGAGPLSSVHLVAGVQFDSQSKNSLSEALFVVRLPFKPLVKLFTSVEQEGLRIPPTPLVTKGNLNLDLLKVISSQPGAPKHFYDVVLENFEKLKQTLFKLSQLKHWIGSLGPVNNLTFSKKYIRDSISSTQHHFQLILNDLPESQARTEIALSEKSRIVLSMSLKNGRVAFDFAGSSAPDFLALSDAATLGVCAGTLVAALRPLVTFDIPLNAGVLRCLEIIAPLGSLVHARYPASVSIGFTDGVNIIANMILKLLGEMDKRIRVAQCGRSQCSIGLQFENDLYFYDQLDPGMGARENRPGQDTLNLWQRSQLHRSVESIEKIFPLRIESVGLRSKSAGEGKYEGGSGQTKEYTVLAPALLSWVSLDESYNADGVEGGRSATSSEILLKRSNSTLQKLAIMGETLLQSGDQILIHSAGGGGYGLS
ncbi:MAG: hydantoinase B/oxoprolinase family protein [Bdellovibrionales bacterium]|nr:hydantoinase B/oxoprolinase family protein [Bdellovibrionales bacterium]